MPGMDGTGPAGMGPGTGWGRGWCYGYAPYSRPGFYGGWGPGLGWGAGWGRGRGFGRGMGRGFRGRFWAGGPPAWAWGGYDPGAWGPYSGEDEVAWLKDRAEMLREEMEGIQQRLDELAADKEKAG